MEIVEIEGVGYMKLEQFSKPILIETAGLDQSDIDKFALVEGFLAEAKKAGVVEEVKAVQTKE